MADIQTYLDEIAHAVKGKDVRDAIYGGIHQCYEDGKAGTIDLVARESIEALDEKKADKTEVDEVDNSLRSSISTEISNRTNGDSALGARIDNLVVSAGGTSPVEVTDAHVGTDGTTYTTLKSRLDSENSGVKNDIVSYVDAFENIVNKANINNDKTFSPLDYAFYKMQHGRPTPTSLNDDTTTDGNDRFLSTIDIIHVDVINTAVNITIYNPLDVKINYVPCVVDSEGYRLSMGGAVTINPKTTYNISYGKGSGEYRKVLLQRQYNSEWSASEINKLKYSVLVRQYSSEDEILKDEYGQKQTYFSDRVRNLEKATSNDRFATCMYLANGGHIITGNTSGDANQYVYFTSNLVVRNANGTITYTWQQLLDMVGATYQKAYGDTTYIKIPSGNALLYNAKEGKFTIGDIITNKYYADVLSCGQYRFERGILYPQAVNDNMLRLERMSAYIYSGGTSECYISGTSLYLYISTGITISDQFNSKEYNVSWNDIVTLAGSSVYVDGDKTYVVIGKSRGIFFDTLKQAIKLTGITNGGSNTEYNVKLLTTTGAGIIQDGLLSEIVRINNQNGNINKIYERLDENEPADYWESAIEVCKEKIIAFRETVGVSNGVVVPFLTDTHRNANNQNSGKLIQKMLKECNLGTFVDGGDIVSGNSIIDKDSILSDIDWSISRYGNAELYRLPCVGNHETAYGIDSAYDSNLPNEIVYSHLFASMSNKNNIVFGGDGSYYYHDLPVCKIRIICLNTSNYASQVDSDYRVTGKNKLNNFLLGKDQMDWLHEKALNMEDGYVALMFSHCHIMNATGEKPQDASLFSSVISAFNNKTSISQSTTGITITTDYSVDYDFSNYHGTVVCLFSGHEHKDVIYDGVIPNIVTTCDANLEFDADGHLTKHGGTDDACAIDFICVDKTSRLIKMIRLGQGNDRQKAY